MKRFGAFLHRLADSVSGDSEEPEIIIEDSHHYEIDDEGKVSKVEDGAEAVLILRGYGDREAATAKLIARLKQR